MGARTRKRRAIAAQKQLSYGERAAVQMVENVKKTRRENSQRAHARVWVAAVTQTGQQYIKGSKPGSSVRDLTREQRTMNKQDRLSRDYTHVSRSSGTAHPVWEAQPERADAGMLGGREGSLATQRHWDRYMEHTRKTGQHVAREFEASEAHTARHTHNSVCECGEEFR